MQIRAKKLICYDFGGLERAPFAGLEAGMPSTPSIGPADVVIPGLLRAVKASIAAAFSATRP